MTTSPQLHHYHPKLNPYDPLLGLLNQRPDWSISFCIWPLTVYPRPSSQSSSLFKKYVSPYHTSAQNLPILPVSFRVNTKVTTRTYKALPLFPLSLVSLSILIFCYSLSQGQPCSKLRIFAVVFPLPATFAS